MNNDRIPAKVRYLAALHHLIFAILTGAVIMNIIVPLVFRDKSLALNTNQISDLKPLSNLTNINTLQLNNNQISDLTPLAKLTTKLGILFLNNNQIVNLKPIASLTNLQILQLSNNYFHILTSFNFG